MKSKNELEIKAKENKRNPSIPAQNAKRQEKYISTTNRLAARDYVDKFKTTSKTL